MKHRFQIVAHYRSRGTRCEKAKAEEATAEDTYYLSLQELRLLMAAQGVLVEM